jgi:hypothetical protein
MSREERERGEGNPVIKVVLGDMKKSSASMKK